VLGIDLGINKRAVSALLTPKGVIKRHEIRFWSDKTRKVIHKQNEEKVANLQRKLSSKTLNSTKREKFLKQLKINRKKVELIINLQITLM
jgi:hypothetical protein